MIAIENIDTSIKKELIVDELMRSKGVYLLVSQPKVGKSMFALQLAYSLTNGIPFLGFEVKSSPVLYITTESDRFQLAQRLKYMNLKPLNNSLYIIDRQDMTTVNLFDIEYEIKNYSDLNKTKVLIIDMFKDFNIGIQYDINDFQDISQKVMPKLRSLADKYNYTILLTHHLNKRKETLGSTGFNACVDGVFNLIETTDKQNIKLITMSRDFCSLDLLLKKDENLVLHLCNENDDEIVDNNLITLIKFAALKVDFELNATEIVKQANLFCTPRTLGKLINSNIDLLKKEGIEVKKIRTSDARKYNFHYDEPNY